ncbi:APC family permease [Georgenia wangjunii]|uniref:APC family permease n=1 Tax=Georgenia wangjunii TaxID=3117730 RepID=UPI002F2688AB
MTRPGPAADPAGFPRLTRRLGTGDAVVIGLSSMIGAGVFAAFSPAAQAAGTGLLAGLAIALVVALANATSSAQLAAAHPTSGGTYAYGRAELGPWWGFAAGWAFVVGKTASCAAMALTFAAYTVPEAWQGPVAALTVVALTAVGYRGVDRTARLARLVVVLVLVALAVAVVGALLGGSPTWPGWVVDDGGAPTAYGIAQSAGLLFFAFAGYARVATLGEEVRDPSRTLPRAITAALTAVALVYVVVALTLLTTLGPAATAASSAPLVDAVVAGGAAWAAPVVRVGAAAASLGALLALLAGVSRTSLAMARGGDLPRALSAVHPRFAVPHRAELAVATVVVVAVLLVDVRGAIGFSSFGVLLYYGVANAAALRQGRAARRYPRVLQVIGIAGCVGLAATLPPASVAAGSAVLVVGLVGRAAIALTRPASETPPTPS